MGSSRGVPLWALRGTWVTEPPGSPQQRDPVTSGRSHALGPGRLGAQGEPSWVVTVAVGAVRSSSWMERRAPALRVRLCVCSRVQAYVRVRVRDVQCVCECGLRVRVNVTCFNNRMTRPL